VRIGDPADFIPKSDIVSDELDASSGVLSEKTLIAAQCGGGQGSGEL
jgi:hypothetical protein